MLLKIHNKTPPEPHSGHSHWKKSGQGGKYYEEVYEQQSRSFEWNPSSRKINFN